MLSVTELEYEERAASLQDVDEDLMQQRMYSALPVGSPCDLDSDEEDLDQYLQVAELHVNEVVFVREQVCVWPTKTRRIAGRLSLVKQHCVLFMSWLPYGFGTLKEDGSFQAESSQATGSTDHTLYAIQPLPLNEVRLLHTHTPRFSGHHWLEVTLMTGLTLPPLHFPPGAPSVQGFMEVIKQHVQLLPTGSKSDTWLVNEVADSLVRSLTALELGDVLLGGPPKGGAHITWAPPTPTPAPCPPDKGLGSTLNGLEGGGATWLNWAANADTMWDVYGMHQLSSPGGWGYPAAPLPSLAALGRSAWQAVSSGVNKLVQQYQQHQGPWFDPEWAPCETPPPVATSRDASVHGGDAPGGRPSAPGHTVGFTAGPANSSGAKHVVKPGLCSLAQDETHEGLKGALRAAQPAAASSGGTGSAGSEPVGSLTSDDGFEMVEADSSPVSDAHLHAPAAPPLDTEDLETMQDPEGRMLSLTLLKSRVWQGGVAPGARKDVWPLLLGLRDPRHTHEQAKAAVTDRRAKYEKLCQQWQQLVRSNKAGDDDQETSLSWWTSCSRIDKDVHRTDRAHPMFAGEGCPGSRALRRLLLSYVIQPGAREYCQGMSDLAAPLLATLGDESEAFWAFVELLRRIGPNFELSQQAMRDQLGALRQLIQLVDPPLYAHLESIGCESYYFTFRWLLIWFKREFKYESVLRLWEAMWCAPGTPYLHMYIAAAILVHHRKAILTHVHEFDTCLKFCVQLSGMMEVEPLIRLATVLYTYVGAAADDMLAKLSVTCQQLPSSSSPASPVTASSPASSKASR